MTYSSRVRSVRINNLWTEVVSYVDYAIRGNKTCHEAMGVSKVGILSALEVCLGCSGAVVHRYDERQRAGEAGRPVDKHSDLISKNRRIGQP